MWNLQRPRNFVVILFCSTLLFTQVSSNCPPLEPNQHVQVTCISGTTKQIIDCSKNNIIGNRNGRTPIIPLGTIATYECSKYYEPTFQRRILHRLTCFGNNQWSRYSVFKEFHCNLGCGKRGGADGRPLLHSGIETNRTSWPWVATLSRAPPPDGGKNTTTKGDFSYICGGTLIGSSTVLTAAHCLTNTLGDNLPPSAFRVTLGSFSSDFQQNLVEGANIFKASGIFPHDQYNPEIFDSDLGIIQLEKAVTLSESVFPACLPRDYQNDAITLSTGGVGELASFGNDGTLKKIRRLVEAKATIITPAYCHRTIGIVPNIGQYCAGNSKDLTLCSGDSGSGMYFTSSSQTKHVVHGVVSASGRLESQCSPHAIFTRVHSYIHWIDEMLLVTENAHAVEQTTFEEVDVSGNTSSKPTETHVTENTSHKPPPGEFFPVENTSRNSPSGQMFAVENTSRKPPSGEFFAVESTSRKPPSSEVHVIGYTSRKPSGVDVVENTSSKPFEGHFVENTSSRPSGELPSLLTTTRKPTGEATPSTKPRLPHSDCRLDDAQGTAGRCTPLKECQYAFEYLKAGVAPKICRGTIVCCPIEPTLAEQKCAEWRSHLYKPPRNRKGEADFKEPRCAQRVQGSISSRRQSPYLEYPHAVALGYIQANENAIFKCSGTLISDQYILTAAICINGTFHSTPLVALLGDTSIKNLGTSHTRQLVQIVDWILPGNYKKLTIFNDIAILKLAEKVRLSRSLLPACLPKPIGFQIDDTFEAVGWVPAKTQLDAGGYSKTYSYYDQFRTENFIAVNLTLDISKDVLSEHDINRGISGGISRVLTRKLLNVKYNRGEERKNTCSGGGPLTRNDIYKGRALSCLFRVEGITAWTAPYCGSDASGIYTKVLSYVPWIERIVFGQQ